MWEIELASGKIVTEKDCFFPDIPEPILSMKIGRLKIQGAEEYYFLRRARAMLGGKPHIEAIEFGGKFGDIVRGFMLKGGKTFEVYYSYENFPHKKITKQGIRRQ